MKKILFFLTALMIALCAVSAEDEGLSADKRQELDITRGGQKIRRAGGLPLFFADARSGQPLAGVTVIVQEVGRFATDKKGFVSLPKLENGDYSMTVSKEGYIQENLSFSVRAGFVVQYRFYLSQNMKGGYLRIVLSWGSSPEDLDIHFEQEGGYHISYRNTHSAEDGSVMLDRDDRNCYGPETITVAKYSSDRVYRLYIADYTNRESRTSSSLSRSNAVVRVYSKDSLLKEYRVPQNIAGNRWNVFSLQGGNIADANTVEAWLSGF